MAAMAGLTGQDAIAELILNPETKRGIDRNTLSKWFPDELAAGRARLKALAGSKFLEAINRGETWALKFALRHLCGWDDDDCT